MYPSATSGNGMVKVSPGRPASPYILPIKMDGPSTGDSDGWEDIAEEIGGAEKSGTITIAWAKQTGVVGGYGVWYDMEDNSTLGGDLLGAAQGFCDTMEAAGLYVGVYASLNWWNNYLTAPGFNQYDRWVAQYYSQCQYKGAYGIWQYTSTWSIGGKNFDGNWAYKDYPALVRAMNGEKEEPELTEAEVKKLARQEIEAYFNELAKKPVSNWAKEAVEFVQAEGLMNGDADGNFRPQSPITRQEVAAVLMNEREK